MQVTLTTVAFECPDAHQLADFYRSLLGWDVARSEPDWVKIVPPGGGPGLSFQSEPAYVRPTWPAKPGEQQMMIHSAGHPFCLWVQPG